MITLERRDIILESSPPLQPLELAFHQQRGARPSCVFQHGLGADYRQCLDVFPESTAYDLACLDCRAHGGSQYGDAANISLSAFANDLVQVIEQQLSPPVVLGGISMGAALSLRIAATRPDLVRALILARPAWGLDAAPVNMQPNLLVGELLSRYAADEARQMFCNTSTYAELEKNAPDNLASLLSFFDKPDARDFAHVLSAIANDGPGIDGSLLQHWQKPTLVLATPDDHVHPVELANELADRLHAGAVKQLPAKHNNKTRYLQQFRQCLSEFLDTLVP